MEYESDFVLAIAPFHVSTKAVELNVKVKKGAKQTATATPTTYKTHRFLRVKASKQGTGGEAPVSSVGALEWIYHLPFFPLIPFPSFKKKLASKTQNKFNERRQLSMSGAGAGQGLVVATVYLYYIIR